MLRMTGDEEINYVNSSIIDAEEEKIFSCESKPAKNEQKQQEENDDEYFLPLITKRNKFKKQKLSERISQESNYSSEPLIEMSHFPSKAKYSRQRLETSSIILPSTVFYERMNFTTKVETDQLLKIYRQLSNTIQQTINSCNLISCPLKHFLLYFEFKTSKKNISQLNHSSSSTKLSKTNSNEENKSTSTLRTSDSLKSLKRCQSIC